MKRNVTKKLLCNERIIFITKFILFGIFLISQISAFAQQKTITGEVTGENGAAIPGVTVVVKGTTNGTVTNVDGKYTLSGIPNNATLVFSFVGLKTQEIPVGNQSTIDVTLEVDAIGLDEVVAIGYGTARKKDLTGSIVNVNAEEVMKYNPESVSEMLRSTVPGLKVGYSTNAKNTPDFEIRGDNTIKADASDERAGNKPLIVVDGVIFNGDLAEINVNDIETVDVLKDASAASIYGSRASNGVVVFTTKKGKSGNPSIRVNAKLGLVGRGKHLDVFKAGDEVMDWLSDLNDALRNYYGAPWSPNRSYDKTPEQYKADWLAANSLDANATHEEITSRWLDNLGFENNEKENYLAGVSYDWNDFLYQDPALRQDYNVGISGRTERVSYYWSVGYKHNQSLQLWETFATLTSRVNVDFKLSDFLNMGLNANMAYQNEGRESVGNGAIRTASPYDMPWENNPDDLHVIIKTRENLRAAGAGSNRGNPLLNPSWTTRLYDSYRIFPTMYAKLSLPFGVTLTSRWTQRINTRKRLYFEDPRNPRFNHGGYIRRQHNQNYDWQLDNILNWNKEFGKHRFDVTGLVNAEKSQSWYTDAQTRLLEPTAALGYHNMGFGLQPQTGSSDEVITRSALMGRINYSYSNRYNLSASFRQDGYSRFGADNVYATFPSISASWTISNESFMAGAPAWLDFLKLRASWGVNGNSSGIGSYAAYAQLSSGKYLNYDGGYVTIPRLYLSRMANPTLAWEKNDAFNIGIDYGFWEGRVTGSIDVYKSQTTELLLDKKLPVVTGFSQITTNVGSLENKGIDLSINASVIQKSDFSWNTAFIMSYNENKILSLTGEKMPVYDDNGNPVVDANGNPVLKEPDDFDNGWFIGENKDIIWNYEFDGVYQVGDEAEAAKYGFSPGDFRVVDQNGDGVLNSKDKKFLGLTKNPWYLTWRNDITWKNFDFGVVFLSKLGWFGGSDNPFNADQTYIKNHNWYNLPYWKPDNPINDAARINSIRISDDAPYYVSKDYLRCQNVTLGYTIPSDLLETIKFRSTRVSFNIENAFIVTKWIEGDPESSREMPRVFSFSVDFSL